MQRVWEARAQLEFQFMFLYSENFLQFNLKKVKEIA